MGEDGMTAEDENIAFTDKGKVEVPPRNDVIEEKLRSEIGKKLLKENIEGELRAEDGQEPAKKKGGMTKDTPQVIFKLVGKIIQCPKFELDDGEAQLMATNLNILLPLDGKMAALVIVLMITINKCYQCFDALSRMFGPKAPEPMKTLQKQPSEPLPEQIK
jgi:hypothetical protein